MMWSIASWLCTYEYMPQKTSIPTLHHVHKNLNFLTYSIRQNYNYWYSHGARARCILWEKKKHSTWLVARKEKNNVNLSIYLQYALDCSFVLLSPLLLSSFSIALLMIQEIYVQTRGEIWKKNHRTHLLKQKTCTVAGSFRLCDIDVKPKATNAYIFHVKNQRVNSIRMKISSKWWTNRQSYWYE